ncbi:MAG: alpha-amylase/4-alpha-glucanotransferase domain-containing protein [Candidatus Aminicenantales bacterium]
MSREFAFLFGVHNHQPVGNFGWVFENATSDCYLPFLKVLREHPKVKFSAHYSGPLLEYFRERRSEAWELLGEMAASGQMELLGGGFFEPILPIIAEADRRGQIEMMNAYLETHFGRRPRGVWLTERVWEPNLASTLASCGIEYTLLDENHFHPAGLSDLHNVFVTEDEGFPLRLLAIDQKLRYLIPFRDLEEIGRYLEKIRAKGGLSVLGDDGEKFGLWPGTKDLVYGKGWLDRFLRYLEENEIKTMTYGEAVQSRPPADRIYLPPASYMEMTEWVLEPDDLRRYTRLKSTLSSADSERFLRAGFFRDFFRKYPESRQMRDRMCGISRCVRKSGDPEAIRELYQGQGNDPYWHGIFGGLYLPHLREAAYEHLLKAEARCPAPDGWVKSDDDLDGRMEYIRRDERFRLWVKPGKSGDLVELDYYPLFRNLTDVLSRRREAYHQTAESVHDKPIKGEHSIHEIAKPLPAGIERLLKPDAGALRSAVDRFLDPDAKRGSWESGEEPDRGEFWEEPSTVLIDGDRLMIETSGRIVLRTHSVPVFVRKEFIPLGPQFQVRTSIRNDGRRRLFLLQGSEWNLRQIPEEIETAGSRVSLCRGRLAAVSLSEAEIWMRPLLTLSQSEKDYDMIHQGYGLLWVRPIEIGPGESAVFTIAFGESDAPRF